MKGCRLTRGIVDSFLDDPGRVSDGHLAACTECASAVERARAFDRSLRLTAESLVVEPLPPAYRLLGPRRAGSPPPGPRFGLVARLGSLASVATVVAVAVAVMLVRPQAAVQPGASTTPRASTATTGPTPSAAVRTPSTACEVAFEQWVSRWQALGGPDHSSDPVVGRTEQPLALAAFSGCSLAALQSANETWLATDGGGNRAQLLPQFDKTIVLLCVANDRLASTAACTDALANRAIAGLYRVVDGDTLTRIAVKLGTSVDGLLAANPWITNPDLIYSGDLLVVPSGAKFVKVIPTATSSIPPGPP